MPSKQTRHETRPFDTPATAESLLVDFRRAMANHETSRIIKRPRQWRGGEQGQTVTEWWDSISKGTGASVAAAHVTRPWYESIGQSKLRMW